MLPKPITPTRMALFLSKNSAQNLHQRCDHYQHQHNALKHLHGRHGAS
jgi:hypothetical protein